MNQGSAMIRIVDFKSKSHDLKKEKSMYANDAALALRHPGRHN